MSTSGWLIALAILAVVNPARLAPALPRGERGRPELVVAGAGGTIGGVALVALAALGSTIGDWLAVSAPTLLVAAGLVVAISGAWATVVGSPSADPALPGRRAALVPVAVPFVLRPEAGLVAVAGGADGQAWAVVAALVLVVVGLGAAAWRPWDAGTAGGRIVRWLGRVVAVAAVGAGVGLAVDGVFAV